MPTISLSRFAGEVPRLPAALLETTSAQRAVNCNFTKGQLTPLRAGYLLTTMANSVSGLYTDDGIHFFTWTVPVQAYRSPTITDIYDRVYYATPSEFKVTQNSLAQLTGGAPSQSWSVGVPPPTAAPTLSAVSRTTIPNTSNNTASGVFFWDDAGTISAEQTVTMGVDAALRSYTFTANPAMTTGATGYLRFKMTDATAGVDLYTVVVSTDPTKSGTTTELPGGVTGSLTTSNNTNFTVTLTYGNFETRAYVVTFTNQFNEESAPSEPALISIQYIQDVQLVFPYDPDDFTGYKPASKYKVYRSAFSGDYILVNDPGDSVPGTAGNITKVDSNTLASEANIVLPSAEWFMPPSGLVNLTQLPNGYFAASKGNIVYFSEPYHPHAWPYSTTVPNTVVGMRAIENSLVVTTTKQPILITGVHPSAVSQTKINTWQAGISNRAMETMANSAVYASNDGIVAVAGPAASLDSSQQLFTREDWRSRYAAEFSGMMFSIYDGQLVVTNSTANYSFMVRLDEASGNYTRLDPTFKTDAVFVLPTTDQMYYSVGTNVYQYQGGAYLTMDWWSRDFVYEAPYCMAVGFIDCDGTTTITVYADGAQYHQTVVNGSGYFWLPGTKLARTWSVRLQGQNVVRKIIVSTSVDELKNA